MEKAQKAFPIESMSLGKALKSGAMVIATTAAASTSTSASNVAATNYTPIIIGVGILLLIFMMKK